MNSMKALVFAAGLGTRLKPLTDTMPKALVPVGGIPMLGRVIVKLRNAGVNFVVVNVHHFPELIISYLKAHNNFGITVKISDESAQLLDTGGGMLAARKWLEDSDFIVHNADILTDFSIKEMVECHKRNDSDVTLLCQKRETNRHFLFDNTGKLCGWQRTDTGESIPATLPCKDLIPYAFGGVSIVSPSIFSHLEVYSRHGNSFSTTPFYASNSALMNFRAYFPSKAYDWVDIGRPDSLVIANKLVSRIICQ